MNLSKLLGRIDTDHYAVLGLPSGEEGTKLTKDQISKAYKSKSLELHPDKRPDDPDANINFHKLKTSYDILKDEKARKLLNDLLLRQKDKFGRQTQEEDSKRQKMMSDLEERERAAFAFQARSEEIERTNRKLQEDIRRYRSMPTTKESAGPPPANENAGAAKSNCVHKDTDLDRGKVLKISWEKAGEDYSAERLRELFGEFGTVEDVVIKISKKKRSALVVMATPDAAATATRNVVGDISNPLLVLPLKPLQSTADSKLSNLVGGGNQNFENSVLEKMLKKSRNQ